MPRKKKEAKPQTLRSKLSQSPELLQVGRRLASLALALGAQEGVLNIRQREELRRALAAAGEELGWAGMLAHRDGAISTIRKDVLTIAKAGAKALAKDLAEELALKRVEAEQLEAAAAAIRKMSESAKTSYPTEYSYRYTARDAIHDTVTKTEVVVANDAAEALTAAEGMDRSLPGRTKLADAMIIRLEERQVRVEEMTKVLPDFIQFSHGLLGEVLTTLQ